MSEIGQGRGSSYPDEIDADASPETTSTKARPQVPNDLASAIIATQTELGTNPAGDYSNVKNRLDGNDTLVAGICASDAGVCASLAVTQASLVGTQATVAGLSTRVDTNFAGLSTRVGVSLDDEGQLKFGIPSEVVIEDDVLIVSQNFHTVGTQGGAASDYLDTIYDLDYVGLCPTSCVGLTPGAVGITPSALTGKIVVLKPSSDERTVVVRHNMGNIWLKGKSDLELDNYDDALALIYDGCRWTDLGAGGGASLFLALLDTPASYIGEKGKIAKVNDAENALEFDLHRQFDNLCRNTAFASRSGGVTTEPDEWTIEGAPVIAYAAVDVGYGDFAIKLTATAPDEGIKQTLTHLKPLAKYQVFTRVKVDAGDTASLITTGAATNINVDSTSAVWENIEGEFITDAGGTDVVIKLVAEANTDVAYFCGITCVEGDIPPGNFIRRVNETIWLITPLRDVGFDGDAFSTSEADIDLSVFGNGCPPKIKAVFIWCQVNDSDSAASATRIEIGVGGVAIATPVRFLSIELSGTPDNKVRTMSGWITCSSGGDIRYKITASGANTLDVNVNILGYVLGE